jgi:LmbE family N-acetylglucosaminyl deacetylase
MKKILVISVHPDDETLGCGGTLLKHGERGDIVSWLIITRAWQPKYSKKIIDEKEREIREVARRYGMDETIRLGFPTTELDGVPQSELIGGLSRAILQVKPEVIYLVYGGDVHGDHRIAFSATEAALKGFRMKEFGIERILSFETLSSTEAVFSTSYSFFPDVFIDITHQFEEKLAIFSLYKTEQQCNLLPRGNSAIEALARVRGATVGVKYAEGFKLLRELC